MAPDAFAFAAARRKNKTLTDGAKVTTILARGRNRPLEWSSRKTTIPNFFMVKI